MSMEELGNVGEILRSIAVVGTLIYLAVQIRQTKQIAKGNAVRNTIVDFQNLWGALRENSEFTSLVRRGINDWSVLSKTEQLRLHSFFINVVIHFESVRSQEYLPDMKELVKGWEDNLLGLIQCPGGREWYEACQYLFSHPFRERINDRRSRPDSLPLPWTAMPWWSLEDSESTSAAV